jgi:hypothetical protein
MNLLWVCYKGYSTKRNGSARKTSTVVVVQSKQPHNTTTSSKEDPPSLQEAVTFAQVMKSNTIKKRTREEFKENPAEDAKLFLQNATRLPQSFEESNSNSYQSASDLQIVNNKLDHNLVLFLVKHCTTRIGAEIGLERCIMDYIFRKQNINHLSKTQQQYISNWQEIFINIEKLVVGSIKDERDADHDTLERAHQRTKNLLHQNFLIKRNLIENDEGLTEEQQDAHVSNFKMRLTYLQ